MNFHLRVESAEVSHVPGRLQHAPCHAHRATGASRPGASTGWRRTWRRSGSEGGDAQSHEEGTCPEENSAAAAVAAEMSAVHVEAPTEVRPPVDSPTPESKQHASQLNRPNTEDSEWWLRSIVILFASAVIRIA